MNLLGPSAGQRRLNLLAELIKEGASLEKIEAAYMPKRPQGFEDAIAFNGTHSNAVTREGNRLKSSNPEFSFKLHRGEDCYAKATGPEDMVNAFYSFVDDVGFTPHQRREVDKFRTATAATSSQGRGDAFDSLVSGVRSEPAVDAARFAEFDAQIVATASRVGHGVAFGLLGPSFVVAMGDIGMAAAVGAMSPLLPVAVGALGIMAMLAFKEKENRQQNS